MTRHTSQRSDFAASAAKDNPLLEPAALLGTTGALRVLIVEDDTMIGMGLAMQLEKLGHTVLAHAGNKAEAISYFRDRNPDLVVLDIRLDKAAGNTLANAGGLDLAEQFSAERRVPMIIITAFCDPELINRASAAGVFGYLLKPVNLELLQAQIEIAVHRFREQEELRTANEQLTQTLETRKLVERAKGIFMKHLKLDEPEAHRRLQMESQKRRISIAELARKVIESEDLLS